MHGNKIKNVPFIRGIFNFVDSLILGTRTLTYSADFFEEEAEKETAMDRWFKKTFKDKAESVVSGLTVALSIVLAIAIFMVLPYFISSLLDTFIRNTKNRKSRRRSIFICVQAKQNPGTSIFFLRKQLSTSKMNWKNASPFRRKSEQFRMLNYGQITSCVPLMQSKLSGLQRHLLLSVLVYGK